MSYHVRVLLAHYVGKLVIAWLIRDDRLLISIRNSFFSESPFERNSKVSVLSLDLCQDG